VTSSQLPPPSPFLSLPAFSCLWPSHGFPPSRVLPHPSWAVVMAFLCPPSYSVIRPYLGAGPLALLLFIIDCIHGFFPASAASATAGWPGLPAAVTLSPSWSSPNVCHPNLKSFVSRSGRVWDGRSGVGELVVSGVLVLLARMSLCLSDPVLLYVLSP